MQEILNWLSNKYIFFSHELSNTFSEYVKGNKVVVTMLLLFIIPIVGQIILGRKKSRLGVIRFLRMFLALILTIVPAYFASSFAIENYNVAKKIGIGNFKFNKDFHSIIAPEYVALIYSTIAFLDFLLLIAIFVRAHKMNKE